MVEINLCLKLIANFSRYTLWQYQAIIYASTFISVHRITLFWSKRKKKRHQIRSSIMMVYVLCIPLIYFLIWCRYQAPIPADQVKSWTEYDYEGRKATSYDCCFNTFLSIWYLFDLLLCMQRALLVCEVDGVAEEWVGEEVIDNV